MLTTFVGGRNPFVPVQPVWNRKLPPVATARKSRVLHALRERPHLNCESLIEEMGDCSYQVGWGILKEMVEEGSIDRRRVNGRWRFMLRSEALDAAPDMTEDLPLLIALLGPATVQDLAGILELDRVQWTQLGNRLGRYYRMGYINRRKVNNIFVYEVTKCQSELSAQSS